MHNFLSVAELRDLVCEQFSPKSKLGWKCLQHLALVNKDWNSSALDLMWSTVDSNWQLCLLFRGVSHPNLVPERRGMAHFDSIPVPPSSNDWERFLSYAGRVRELRFKLDCFRHLPVRVLEKIDFSGTSAFTHLRVIKSHGQIQHFNIRYIIWLLRATLGDNVVTLELRIPSSPIAVFNTLFVKVLSARGRALENINIMPYNPTWPFEDNGFDLPLHNLERAHFTSLRTLHLGFSHVSQASLNFLMSFPHLISIGLHDIQRAPGPLLHWPSITPSFLEHMTLSNIDLDRLSHLLNLNPAPQCNSFTSRFDFRDSELSVRPVSKALALNQWFCLKAVTLEAASYPQGGPGQWMDVSPLLALPAIENFTYMHSDGVLLSKVDITAALSSWKYLRSFHVSCPNGPDERHWRTSDTRISLALDVLDIFANLCPAIEKIGLLFCSPSDELDGIDLPPLEHLNELDITLSSNIDWAKSSAYLRHRAPRLRALSCAGCNLLDGQVWTPGLTHQPFRTGTGWEELALELAAPFSPW